MEFIKNVLARMKSLKDKIQKKGEPNIEELITALGDEEWMVSQSATWELESLGEPAVEPLIAALQSDNWDTAYRASLALGHLGEPAVEPLMAALQSGNENTVFLAASALGELGDARAIDPLARLHEHTESVKLREKAGLSLGKLGDPRSIPTLVGLLGTGNSRTEAKEALAEMGCAAVAPTLASLRAELKRVPKGYTSSKADHISVLGEIGDARAVDVLEKLSATDNDDRLQIAALEALSQIGHSMALTQEEIADLRDSLLANDYDVRKSALARAQLIARSADSTELNRAFRASEKLQTAYDKQMEALSGAAPMQACREAIELQPDFSAAYVCLSYLYCEYAQEPKEAQKWADKAIQIDPKNVEAWTALGKAHVALGDAPKAARAFHQVVTIDPQHQNLEPLARLIAVYRRLRMVDAIVDAEMRLNRARVRLDPDHEREWDQVVLAADPERLRESISS